MADKLYLPQVDYTSRDYASIRDDLISLIPNFAPQWTSRDSSDFGIVLLELFAYTGDLLNYYIDRAANESFIDTATQRDTVLKIAALLGYTPNGTNPSTGQVIFSNNTNAAVTVPAYTKVAATGVAGDTVIFETNTSVTVPAAVSGVAGTSGYVAITQGSTISNEALGTSDGSADQEFKLANTGVVTSGQTVNGVTSYSITLLVNSTLYSQVESFVDYAGTDTVFTVRTDGSGFTYIKFGDGTHGAIPANNSTITASYRTCSGAAGNVSVGAVNTVLQATDGTYPAVTVNNDVATSGGQDAESTDSIRINAPKALRSLNRAVSLSDYANVALQVQGVSKAIAIASVYTSVNLYVAAAGGNTLSDTLASNIATYFADKIPPATILKVQDYTPVYPSIDVTVNAMPSYKQTDIQSAVTNALYDILAFDSVDFNDVISSADIRNAVMSVVGVQSVTVNGLSKKTISIETPVVFPTTISTVYCNVNEIPVLNKDYIKVTVTGGTL